MIGRSRRAAAALGLVGRYALLTVLAFIVLFPIYITIVNSLLPTGADRDAAADALPDESRSGSTYSDAWNGGAHGRRT